MKSNIGFTLFEIIVVLVLVGIVTLFASMGLIDAVESYVKYRQYSEYNLKIEVAISRLFRELKELHEVSDYSTEKIRYKRDNQDYTIALVGENLKINDNASYPNEDTGYVLIDKVQNFHIVPKKADNSQWQIGDDIDELAKLDISFAVVLSSPININFSVNPWFNDTYNGP